MPARSRGLSDAGRRRRLRGAALPFGLLVPGRGLAARRAGAARAELGHVALALTDHNSVSGSMELAQTAARARRCRAIHGAEIDLDRETRRLRCPRATTSRCSCRDERGWRNLCRILTLAHAHTRDGSRPARARRAVGRAGGACSTHAEGLVCLTGCASRSVLVAARDRRGAAAPATRAGRAAPARGVRRGAPVRRAAAPLRARRPRPQPRVGGGRPAAGGADVATGDVHAHCARASRAAGRVRGAAQPARRSTPPSRCAAATAAT